MGMKFVRAFITLVICVALASQSSYGLSLSSLDRVLEWGLLSDGSNMTELSYMDMAKKVGGVVIAFGILVWGSAWHIASNLSISKLKHIIGTSYDQLNGLITMMYTPLRLGEQCLVGNLSPDVALMASILMHMVAAFLTRLTINRTAKMMLELLELISEILLIPFWLLKVFLRGLLYLPRRLLQPSWSSLMGSVSAVYRSICVPFRRLGNNISPYLSSSPNPSTQTTSQPLVNAIPQTTSQPSIVVYPQIPTPSQANTTDEPQPAAPKFEIPATKKARMDAWFSR